MKKKYIKPRRIVKLCIIVKNQGNKNKIIYVYCSVKTEPVSGGILSRLFVAGAKRTDAGVYSCIFGDARASVVVHVLTGKIFN